MKKYIALLLLLPLATAAQDIRKMKAPDITTWAASPDTVYVINFWATWCAPCVQELPAFNELQQAYQHKPVSILLVSLNFKESWPWELQGFVKRKKLLPQTAWLDETDPSEFIPKIEKGWEGSIPATLVIRPMKYRSFTEGRVNYNTLREVVERMLR